MAEVVLDKTFQEVTGTYGSVTLRVVVVKKPQKGQPLALDSDAPEIEAELAEIGKGPLSSYLERPDGKYCTVFLVNGQRHDQWDSTFIVRDLGFKYLRTRTMLVVDLDGLAPDAIAEIVQGSRQGLYKGNVYDALRDRIVATLKDDPDLKRLQAEAEQEIAELQAGDEAVRRKLDQLIEEHHAAATRKDAGPYEPGIPSSTAPGGFGQDARREVVTTDTETGSPAAEPILVLDPGVETIRLRPNIERTVLITAEPSNVWTDLTAWDLRLKPKVEELKVKTDMSPQGARLSLRFVEPDGFDENEYPIDVTLTAFAQFKGFDEPRMLKREITISKPKEREERPKPVLFPTPTDLKVVTRQPVRLIPGGPSTHVRLRWNGQDSLVGFPGAPWVFSGTCSSLSTFPPLVFTRPRDGRFEVVLDTPQGLIAGQVLDFEIEVIGPVGARLTASFQGEIAELPAPDPRRVKVTAPDPTAQRRPPYDLRTVKEAQWESPTCWGDTAWTKDDAAAYEEPTATTPLVLIINEDMELLKHYRDEMVKRQLEESTVKERTARYVSHVAFHLYQMYLNVKQRREEQAEDENVHVPDDAELKSEINRVASTLIRLMEVSQR